MEKRNIIVIGASAGGFEAIKKLISGLSGDLEASIFIVWHISSDVSGIMLVEGEGLRFRCHTGHAFSADSLMASITQSIEESLWSAIRNGQESVLFLNHMGDHFAEVNQPKLAAMYFKKTKEADQRADLVRRAVLNHEQLSSDGIREQADQSD